MPAATSSVSDLVSQMQQNLDAIHQHLARISDTKAHDDEIERLENERQKRVEELKLEREREVNELTEKRKQAAEAAAEKRRQERERIAARRKQEEDDLAAARKREDEERLAKLQQEEEELKAIAQKEEEEREAIYVAEVEKKRLEAEEKENSLHDEVDNQMTQLEDEMERRMAEGQKVLKELDEKRKAINAMIDAQMHPSAVKPIFRRGSKRYSASPLAADVAAILARKTSPEHKPSPLKDEKHTNEPQPTRLVEAEQVSDVHNIPSPERMTRRDISPVESKPVYIEIPKDLPTPAPSEHTPKTIERTMSSNASIFSTKSEDPEDIRAREEMARINAEIMAEMEAEPSFANSQRESFEDPEDVRAREEMAKINAEIMAAQQAGEQAQNTRTPEPEPVKRQSMEDPEDIRAREEMERLNAEIMIEALAAEQAKVTAPQLPSVTPHEHFPTWQNQAELLLVRGSHGVLRFRDGGADMEVMEAPVPERMEKKHEPFIYKGPKHALLPTWTDQSQLSQINGAHATLVFREGGADMAPVEAPRREDLQVPILGTDKRDQFLHGVTQHQLLPTWADQALLPVLKGAAHGRLIFREGGADMEVLQAPGAEDPLVPQTLQEEPTEELDQVSKGVAPLSVVVPEALWFGQAKSPVARSGHSHNFTRQDPAEQFTSHMSGYFRTSLPVTPDSIPEETETDMLGQIKQPLPVIEELPETTHRLSGHLQQRFPFLAARMAAMNEEPESQLPGHIKQKLPLAPTGDGLPVIEQHILTQSIPNGLGSATMNHGAEKKTPVPELAPEDMPEEVVVIAGETYDLENPALEELVQRHTSPYWAADQGTLELLKGTHANLIFKNGLAAMEAVQAPPEPHPYWNANQADLLIIKGIHANLIFKDGIAAMEAVEAPQEPHPYWNANQADLQIVKGTHANLIFKDGLVVMEAVQAPRVPHPYWNANQADLEIMKGTHANLIFKDGLVVMEAVQAPRGSHPYWAADQGTLELLKGTHANLIFKNGLVVMEAVQAPRGSHPYWHANQAHLRIVKGTHANLVFKNGLAAMEAVQASRGPHPYWNTNQAHLRIVKGTHANLVFKKGLAAMEAVQASRGPHPYWNANQADLQIVKGTHANLIFKDGFAATEAVQAPRVPHPYWNANQADLQIVKGSHGVLIFHKSGAHLASVAHQVRSELAHSNPYWNINQAELQLIRGSHGMLIFRDGGADMEVVVANEIDFTKNRYWIDQATLATISGSHATLAFHSAGADMKIAHFPPEKEMLAEMPVARKQSSYWDVDQAGLEVLRGSHSTLVFRDGGAYMMVVHAPTFEEVHSEKLAAKEPTATRANPYWVMDQATLATVSGTHAQLAFNEEGASLEVSKAPHAYWSKNQASLEVVRGTHAQLAFNGEGASLEVSKAPHAYWSKNQASLEVVRGAHAQLAFNEEGASLEVSKAPHAYWSKNQASLEVVRGTHAQLAFNEEGASLEVSKAPHAYWSKNQAHLEVVRGTHATLHFTDDGAALQAVKARKEPVVDTSKALASSPAPASEGPNPAAYWAPDQGQLEKIMGSHSMLVFDNNGATMIPYDLVAYDRSAQVEIPRSIPDHRKEVSQASVMLPPNPAAYWAPDQGQLERLQGSHGMLVFDNDGAAMVPHVLPSQGLPSPVDQPLIGTGASIPQAFIMNNGTHFVIDDFSDTNSEASFVSQPDYEDGIAQPVVRDARSTSGSDRAHRRSLSDVPELEAETTIDVQKPHENHVGRILTSNGSHEAFPKSEEYPVNDHFYHDAKRNSGHMLFEDADSGNEGDVADDFQDAEDHPTRAPNHRSSMGPGAFASLVNIVKDNVPLVGQLVDNKRGSYSPVHDPQHSLRREQSLHVRTDTADTMLSSHEAGSSPLTPSDSTASPIHVHQDGVDEPVIRTSWPETENHHEAGFDAYESRQDIKPQASPLSTQTEFDAYSPQLYPPALKSPALKSPASIKSIHSSGMDMNKEPQPAPERDEFQLGPRSQYRPSGLGSPDSFKTKLPQVNTTQDRRSSNGSDSPQLIRRSTGIRPESRESRPSQIPTRSARRGTVTERVNDLGRTPNSSPTVPSNSFFSKTRALFESNAAGPTVPEVPRTRPGPNIFHVSPLKPTRSSLSHSELPQPSPSENEFIAPRSLDINPKSPSPGYPLPAGQSHEQDSDRDRDFYARPTQRNSNSFLAALGTIGNGRNSYIHNPTNAREKERLLGRDN